MSTNTTPPIDIDQLIAAFVAKKPTACWHCPDDLCHKQGLVIVGTLQYLKEHWTRHCAENYPIVEFLAKLIQCTKDLATCQHCIAARGKSPHLSCSSSHSSLRVQRRSTKLRRRGSSPP